MAGCKDGHIVLSILVVRDGMHYDSFFREQKKSDFKVLLNDRLMPTVLAASLRAFEEVLAERI